MCQKIIWAKDNYEEVGRWLKKSKRVMLVCGHSITKQRIDAYFKMIATSLGVTVIRFMDFEPNPLYESVVSGVRRFREEHCDAIIAVGGGSAIDVAKCIRIYSGLQGTGERGEWLGAQAKTVNIPFLAMPTTAGTGSEVTRYAVIYYDGKKQSITSEDCIPDTVLMDPSCLEALPLYQKKATMMDAFCHAVESFWSVNSTEESKRYSRAAISGIIDNMDAYLKNDEIAMNAMLMAANTAGKAINITQTTAGHAMCYKITSLFGIAHGHAAILCVRALFPWMIENTDKCIDPRGEEYVKAVLDEIADAMGCRGAQSASKKLIDIFDRLGLDVPAATDGQYKELKASVNPERLKNYPIGIDEDTIDRLYHEILR